MMKLKVNETDIDINTKSKLYSTLEGIKDQFKEIINHLSRDNFTLIASPSK